RKRSRRWAGSRRLCGVRRRGVIKFGVQGGPFDQLGVCAGDDPGGSLDPGLTGVDCQGDLLVLLQRQGLDGLEDAVFVDGFDRDRHGWLSLKQEASAICLFYPPRRSPTTTGRTAEPKKGVR